MIPAPNTDIEFTSNFDFVEFNHRVIAATHPEQLRDILFLIYDELIIRGSHFRNKLTGFEGVTDHDLHVAFYRTANQMIVMWSDARN